MKSIAIESDVYEHLLQQVAQSGQNISTILRQALGLNTRPNSAQQKYEQQPSGLDALLSSTEFRFAKGVVGRFLVILSWIHSKHPSRFKMVEEIKGRGRLYFARTPKILAESGRSVNPKQIPGSVFWVITTTPTDLKQEILEKVMTLFDYSPADVGKAVAAIDEKARRLALLESI